MKYILFIAISLGFVSNVGGQTRSLRFCDVDNLSAIAGDVSAVGGVPIEYLVLERVGCETMEIVLNEIVLSNGVVTVSGSYTGPSDCMFKIDPAMFRVALSAIILRMNNVARPFRLVGDDEFSMINPLPKDCIFESSKMFGGGNAPIKFTYSYEGFPSDSEIMSWNDKNKMNIISTFDGEYSVKYILRFFLTVRFFGQNYQYPNEEYSWINVRGSGDCVMKVMK